jgi:hypothetical protein
VQATVPPGHRALVAALDGSRPLGALAAGDGRALALARRLLELGLAEPAAG